MGGGGCFQRNAFNLLCRRCAAQTLGPGGGGPRPARHFFIYVKQGNRQGGIFTNTRRFVEINQELTHLGNKQRWRGRLLRKAAVGLLKTDESPWAKRLVLEWLMTEWQNPS